MLRFTNDIVRGIQIRSTRPGTSGMKMTSSRKCLHKGTLLVAAASLEELDKQVERHLAVE